ncbi:MAG TPA: DUF3037 domain-containing protein [Acidisarcina sp.]
MAELRQCEFLLVRYVPDPVKNEFVNIGVVLRDRSADVSFDENGIRNTLVRFTKDWGRVRCVDPEADVTLFEALESDIRRRLGESTARPDVQPVMSMIEDSFSNALQITSPKACLAESMAAEMENLMRLHVETAKRPRDARQSGRQAIYGQMRTQFERAGVWDLMRKRIAAASYTADGDPLRIDCGYRPNGVVRMFHAVSLEGDLETAKVLAFSMAAMRAGVKRVEGAELELTAIIEPLRALDGGRADGNEDEDRGVVVRKGASSEEGDRTVQYRFAINTMEQQSIRVLTTSDLPRVAEAARVDLRI